MKHQQKQIENHVVMVFVVSSLLNQAHQSNLCVRSRKLESMGLQYYILIWFTQFVKHVCRLESI
jgi:hypothetical protein